MGALTFDNTKKLIETKDYRIQINEAGQGHPMFLIHGTGPGASGWSNFSPNITALSEKYRCIAVTMPGWGESSPQTVRTGRDQAETMRQLMDAMGIDRAAFVGNSMGGMISLEVTAKHPQLVTHLITMGSAAPGVNILAPGGLSEGLRVLVETYADPSPENFKRVVKVMCYDPAFGTDALAEERSRGALEFPEHNQNWLELWRTGYGMATFNTIVPALMESTVPALIVHGHDDRTVPFESSLRLVSMIPDSRLVLLNHCAHWAQLEHATEFNRLVDDFITHH